MRKILIALACLPIIVYGNFTLAFYAGLSLPEGWSCRPTITFDAKCTSPTGKVYVFR